MSRTKDRKCLFYGLWEVLSVSDFTVDSSGDDSDEVFLSDDFLRDLRECFEDLDFVLHLSPHRDRPFEAVFDFLSSLRFVVVVVVVIEVSCGIAPSVACADLSGEDEGVEPPRPLRRRAEVRSGVATPSAVARTGTSSRAARGLVTCSSSSVCWFCRDGSPSC
ncbi:hypothetical protein MTO96_014825 [Rhipicephalus appendiculatus]